MACGTWKCVSSREVDLALEFQAFWAEYFNYAYAVCVRKVENDLKVKDEATEPIALICC